MKHETFKTEAERLLDLSRPSLEALSHVLRNRGLWPENFTWDYWDCRQCAAGMACRLWDEINFTRILAAQNFGVADLMRDQFNMPDLVAWRIFIGAGKGRYIANDDVTPEMVADDIDAYLATQKDQR